jgi:sec-independent protein translocase protein TatB
VFGMSWAEIIIVITVGMFVLGPERIPVAVKWLGSTLKTVRTMAAGAQEQLQGEFGPELEELKRQIADLQSLKEIQELRSLRDLNPRALITKNILGDEFSGGFTGLLGLNQGANGAAATGSGVAPEIAAPSIPAPDSAFPEDTAVTGTALPDITVPAVTVNDPIDLTKPAESNAGGNHAAPNLPTVKINNGVEINNGVDTNGVGPVAAPRHLASASFDSDAT